MKHMYINLHNSQKVLMERVWLGLYKIANIKVEAVEGWFHICGPESAITQAYYELVGLKAV